ETAPCAKKSMVGFFAPGICVFRLQVRSNTVKLWTKIAASSRKAKTKGGRPNAHLRHPLFCPKKGDFLKFWKKVFDFRY
ncbi:MAG: hypothetical protein IJX13_01930, partial [Clostridia bacterium]|nr:hypothetical protein [Clostridia bacterium]